MAIAPISAPAIRWPGRLAASLLAPLLLGGGLVAGRLTAPPPPAPPPPRVQPLVIERVVAVPPPVATPCPETQETRHGRFAPIHSNAEGSSSLDVVELCPDHYAIIDAGPGPIADVQVTLVPPDQAPRTIRLPLLAPRMVDHYRWSDHVAAVGGGRRIAVAGTRMLVGGYDQVAFISQDGGATWGELPLGRDLGEIDHVALTATELVMYVGRGDDRRHLRVPLGGLVPVSLDR